MSTRHVVICEDDPGMAKLLTQVVASFPGMEAHTFESVGRALLEIEKLKPALIIMDHMMPGATGIDGVSHLRRTPWGRDIPVLVYSAADVEAQAFAGGANAFLRKPTSVAALREKIRGLLGI